MSPSANWDFHQLAVMMRVWTDFSLSVHPTEFSCWVMYENICCQLRFSWAYGYVEGVNSSASRQFFPIHFLFEFFARLRFSLAHGCVQGVNSSAFDLFIAMNSFDDFSTLISALIASHSRSIALFRSLIRSRIPCFDSQRSSGHLINEWSAV